MTTIINASRLIYPAFIEPTRRITPSDAPRYGCLIMIDDVPDDLRTHVKPKPARAHRVETTPGLSEKDLLTFIPQPFKPRLTFANAFTGLRQWMELQELAGAANIPANRLFHNIPARLAVEPVEMIDAVPYGATQRSQAVKRLQVVSIRVDIGDLTGNLERMLTEHFNP